MVEDGHATETLTFRRDGRWVLVTVKRDEAGEVEDQYAAQGGWEQTATTIAKTWHPWDDETDLPAVEPLTAAKRYTLTADTLTVQRWPEDEPDSPDVTMRRVTDAATLPSLAGDWVREEFNEAGDLERRWTITATDAGFTYTFSDSNGKFEMTGSTWTDDPENQIIRMVLETVPPEPNSWWAGSTLHFAYVPHGDPDTINVSLWYREQRVEGEDDARHWSALPNRAFPHGDFWHALRRAEP